MMGAALPLSGAAFAAAAEDLAALAWLHEAERDVETLTHLRASGFPEGLALIAADDPVCVAMSDALKVISGVAEQDKQKLQDDLAADYAAIYLTHALRASPCESVWLDEENLMMQAPSFAVREYYKKHGIAAKDWRQMADDHLANELAFVAYLLGKSEGEESRSFLADHLLKWLPMFAERVSARASTNFYAALANLTLRVVENLRSHLETNN